MMQIAPIGRNERGECDDHTINSGGSVSLYSSLSLSLGITFATQHYSLDDVMQIVLYSRTDI